MSLKDLLSEKAQPLIAKLQELQNKISSDSLELDEVVNEITNWQETSAFCSEVLQKGQGLRISYLPLKTPEDITEYTGEGLPYTPQYGIMISQGKPVFYIFMPERLVCANTFPPNINIQNVNGVCQPLKN